MSSMKLAPGRPRGRGHDIAKHVGFRIRQARLARGMSMREVGEIVGVTEGQMTRYETAQTVIAPAMLYVLGRALQVFPGWFYEDFQEDRNRPWLPVGAPADALPEEARTLLNALYQLPEEQRASVHRLVASMLETALLLGTAIPPQSDEPTPEEATNDE